MSLLASSTAPIDAGTVLRTSKAPGAEPQADLASRPVPPPDAFVFQSINEGEDDRGFAGQAAASCDWEQHQACCGPEGCLERRAALGSRDTHVWRLLVEAIRAPCTTGAGQPVSLDLRHWPVKDNESHSHLLLGQDAKAHRKAAKTLLQLASCLAFERPQANIER